MSDVTKYIWDRNLEMKGIITKESKRHCAVCGRHSCYIVLWDDGTRTKPCTAGVSYLPNGDLIID